MKLMPLLLLFAACGDDASATPQGCQPLLGGADCLLPYPSDYFRSPDPNGYHIAIADAAKVKDMHGHPVDPTTFWQADGFSRVSQIVATLGAPVAHDGLVGILDDYAGSTMPQSRTLLINATTGELIPHYVDVDSRPSKPTRQGIALYPAILLAPKTRYVVALQNIVGADGMPVPAPKGFQKLRDHQVGDDDAALKGIATHFDSDVFPVIVRAGVARGSLQLAWDFTTASDEHPQEDMKNVREQTLAWLDQNQIQVTVDSVEQNTDADVWLRVRGTITGPLFMEDANPGAILHRDASGKVVQNGMATFPYIAQVPMSLMTATTPARALAFGHGFFGSRDEITGAAVRHISDRLQMVVFGIDWWGMSQDDAGKVAYYLAGDPSNIDRFTDRVHQAMANWLVMTAAIRGPLAQQMALQRTGGAGLYDPSTVYFLGISEGHILGSVMCSLNPDITRAVLNVGGASWTHMMFRARPFSGFLGVLDTTLPDGLSEYEFTALARSAMDRIDPAIWAEYLLGGGLPRNPAQRHVLLQIGIGDDEVINPATFLQARILGIPQMAPNAMSGWNLEQKMAPMDSALAVWDFGVDYSYYATPEPLGMENGVHEGLRRLDTVIDQMDQHLRPNGMILNTCGGVCTSAH
jgi:hypothetical protein